MSDGCLKFLGKVSKSSEGWGGCTNFFALRAPDDDHPHFRPIDPIWTPPKCRYSVYITPKLTSQEKFLRGKFCEPSPKKQEIANILYNLAIFSYSTPEILHGSFHLLRNIPRLQTCWGLLYNIFL